MKIPAGWRWPLLCVSSFLALAFPAFLGAGLSAAEAADCAVAALAGTRPMTVTYAAVEALDTGWLVALYALGLGVRIFLIACCAAFLVRRATEKSELRAIRRILTARMRAETAELPDVRTFHWN
jgi:hypothetical protein